MALCRARRPSNCRAKTAAIVLIESLRKLGTAYGPDLTVMMDGAEKNLGQVAEDLANRHIRIFTRDASGRRAVFGAACGAGVTRPSLPFRISPTVEAPRGSVVLAGAASRRGLVRPHTYEEMPRHSVEVPRVAAAAGHEHGALERADEDSGH